MEQLEFLPGEHLLKSSREKYNADGCIIDEDANEMFLLETSGKLVLNEKWKYGYDHVKCTFGALSIFNAAFKKCHFATEETAIKLQIPYIHAMEDSLHLWVLELCSKELYISNKVFKCQIPKATDDTKNIIAMGNLLWCLKMKLERVHNILKGMKEEHGTVVARFKAIFYLRVRFPNFLLNLKATIVAIKYKECLEVLVARAFRW